MARYTSTIQDILMMYVWEDGKEKELVSKKQIVEYGRPKFFNFDYPLYSEEMKEKFELDFIRHFYMREHGLDSIALFKNCLEDYLFLSHDKWKRVFDNMTEEINPFVNMDLKTIKTLAEREQDNKTATRDQREDTTNETIRKDDKDRIYSEDLGRTDNKERIYSEDGSTVENGQTDTNVTDFNRSVIASVPDNRVELTLNDGVGALNYADTINETRDKSDTRQDSLVSTTQETDGNETNKTIIDENKNGLDNITTLTNEDKTGNKVLDRDETENKQRDFEQDLDEHKKGKIGNVTYTTMYNEFIRSYEGIHKQMFREMSHLFMGLLN